MAKKVTDLINQKEGISFSFEVTPDVSEELINNLKVDPVFFSVTWHAKSHQCKDLDVPPLRTAKFLKHQQKDVLLHLSCDLLRIDYLDQLIIMLQDMDICNLFLVLGESYDTNTSDFKTTLELIKYIKKKTGDYFCIGIAGFPDCDDEKLLQLKEKIEGGADFVITQAFFEPDVYKKLLDRCEKIGINVPMIPGMFPFETYRQLYNFTNICQVKVSDDLLQIAKSKDNEDMSCIGIVKKLIELLNREFNSKHFHVFTLNKLQNTMDMIEQLGTIRQNY